MRAVLMAGVRYRGNRRSSNPPSPAMATRLRQLSQCGPALIPPGPAPARDGLPLAQRPSRRRDVLGQVEVRLAPSSHWTRPVPGATLPSSARILLVPHPGPSSLSGPGSGTSRLVTSPPS